MKSKIIKFGGGGLVGTAMFSLIMTYANTKVDGVKEYSDLNDQNIITKVELNNTNLVTKIKLNNTNLINQVKNVEKNQTRIIKALDKIDRRLYQMNKEK